VPAELGYTIVSSPDHFQHGHPESPSRFQFLDLPGQWSFSADLLEIQAMPISEEIILGVHAASYIDSLRGAPPGILDLGDTYSTGASFEAAKLACGGATQVVKAVCDGSASMGFALVRPPGHHATSSQAMGFCLINNIAVGARLAQQHAHEKVLILDIDVHHGNGTESIFFRDPSVMFISAHQWGIYPGSGAPQDIGRDEGAGTVCNIPLPSGVGDEGYQSLITEIVLPLARRFSPEIILVSCGFDAHWRDPLASLQLSLAGYNQLTRTIRELALEICEGKLVYVLEGGYDPRVVAHGAAAILHGMLSQEYPDDPFGPAPQREPPVESLIKQLKSIHSIF
jgi:acetoin utilization deacetylase AcuC-like enzyme